MRESQSDSTCQLRVKRFVVESASASALPACSGPTRSCESAPEHQTRARTSLSSHSPQTTHHTMATSHTKDSAHSLDPPPVFSLVHPLLYRSSSHSFLSHSAFYRQLRLKTILLLGLELPGRPLVSWCDKNAVRLVSLLSRCGV